MKFKFAFSASLFFAFGLFIRPLAPTAFAQDASAPTQISDQTPIKFAGVWLTGRNADADKYFPIGKKHTLKFGSEEGNVVSRKILAEIRKEAVPNGKRLIDAIAPDDYRPEASAGKALVMACSINYEHVDSKRIGQRKPFIMAEVGFDLIICDFSTRSIVACLPGRFERNEMAETEDISEAQKEQILDQIYTQEMPAQFIKICKAHGPEIMGLDSAGVTKVTVFDEAMKVIPDHIKDRYESYFANLAGSNFYEGVGLPLLPFSRGSEMVFCAMQENLSDATNSVINNEESADGMKFSLKKPLYEVELTIPAFKTVTAQATEERKIVQTCCYSRITIKKGEEIIYTAQHEANKQTRIPTGSSQETPWLAYSNALNEMFFSGSKKIKSLISASSKKQEKPLLIINPSGIKGVFVACAPWSIVNKTK
jgi:hypothetical protein